MHLVTEQRIPCRLLCVACSLDKEVLSRLTALKYQHSHHESHQHHELQGDIKAIFNAMPFGQAVNSTCNINTEMHSSIQRINAQPSRTQKRVRFQPQTEVKIIHNSTLQPLATVHTHLTEPPAGKSALSKFTESLTNPQTYRDTLMSSFNSLGQQEMLVRGVSQTTTSTDPEKRVKSLSCELQHVLTDFHIRLVDKIGRRNIIGPIAEYEVELECALNIIGPRNGYDRATKLGYIGMFFQLAKRMVILNDHSTANVLVKKLDFFYMFNSSELKASSSAGRPGLHVDDLAMVAEAFYKAEAAWSLRKDIQKQMAVKASFSHPDRGNRRW